MASGFRVEFGRIEAGWADIRLSDVNARCEAQIAYGTDGLGQFLTAVSAVVTRRLLGATAYWDDEPGFWTVDVRQGDDAIALTVERDDEFPGRAPAVVFRAAFSHESDLARAAIVAYEAVLERNGADDYRERWSHPFPQAELDALRAWLAEDEAWWARQALHRAVFARIVCHGELLSAQIAAALAVPHERVLELLSEIEGFGRLRLVELTGEGNGAGVEIDPNSVGRHIDARRFREAVCGEQLLTDFES